MKLETTHKGRIVKYDEDKNIWECPELDLEGKSLSAVKGKIDSYESKERKLGDGVPLLKLDNYRHNREAAIKVRATMLDKDIQPGDSYVPVWITHVNGGGREKVGIHNLILDTPENLEILAESIRLSKEADAINKKASKMVADIPRMTIEQIKALALEVKP